MIEYQFRVGLLQKTVLPALLIFTIPVLSFFFFRFAQADLERRVMLDVEEKIHEDMQLLPDERDDLIDALAAVPVSEILTEKSPTIAARVDELSRSYYSLSDWMLRLGYWDIASGILAYVFLGLCVLNGKRSVESLAWSLSASWQLMRALALVIGLAHGALILSAAVWVLAFWISIDTSNVVIAALVGMLVVLSQTLHYLYRPLDVCLPVEAVQVDPNHAAALWKRVHNLCQRVDTDPPDQILATVQDDFFVTEQPLLLEKAEVTGRTLCFNLLFLKYLKDKEVEAILIHEFAHFRDEEIFYNREITPALIRYAVFLNGLAKIPWAYPFFSFGLLFRSSMDTSLAKFRREREIRADQIATEMTSREATIGGILRMTAIEDYLILLENALFESDATHDDPNLADRIDDDYPQTSQRVAEQIDEFCDRSTPHPFDAHQTLAERLGAQGFPITTSAAELVLAGAAEHGWYNAIPNAASIEQAQWAKIEEEFSSRHDNALAFRYLPSDEEERAVVEKNFPATTFDGYMRRPIHIDCEKMHYEEWAQPVYFGEIFGINLTEPYVLQINSRSGLFLLRLSHRDKERERTVTAIRDYQKRYRSALSYQRKKAREAKRPSDDLPK